MAQASEQSAGARALCLGPWHEEQEKDSVSLGSLSLRKYRAVGASLSPNISKSPTKGAEGMRVA